MTYDKVVQRYGRAETITDIQSFARDLSSALGGSPLDKVPEERIDAEGQASFRLGPDTIHVSTNHYGSKGRVKVRIVASDVGPDDRDIYNKAHRTQEAAVDPNARDIKRIAADIKRRVIDPSQEALARQREYAEQRKAGRSGLAGYLAQMVQACPSMQALKRHPHDTTAGLHSGAAGHYIQGTLHEDGTVSIDRIASMPFEAFVGLVAFLNSKGD